MSNYVNCALHTTFDPNFLYIKEPEPTQEAATQSRIERVALLALPFLSLYRPLGKAISISVGTYHSISHLISAVSAGTEGAWKKCALRTAQTGLAILTIGASLLHFRIGLLLTTGIDIAKSGFDLGLCLYQLNWLQALGKGLELSTGIFYLGIMMTGALEIVLLALVLQAATCFYQAYKEYNQERYPEVIAKIAMGMIRLFQVNQTREMIQRRNVLLAAQKYKNLSERIQRGKTARALLTHRLINLQKEMKDRQVILSDAKNKEYDVGSHFHGHGGHLVKGENLLLQTKTVNGQPVIELTFKVNHAFLGEIRGLIKEIERMDPKEVAEILQLFGSHATDIAVDEEEVWDFPFKKIIFKGLGSIQIGDSLCDDSEDAEKVDMEKAVKAAQKIMELLNSLGRDSALTREKLLNILQAEHLFEYYFEALDNCCFDSPNLYNRVVVQIEANKTLFDLHELLSMLSLEDALAPSTLEDQEIHKLFFLYHTFDPRKATLFERKIDSWSLSSEELKKTMLTESPKMKEVFETYLPKMEKCEIFPGKMRYQISGLSELAYAKGARGLIATITGTYSLEEQYDRIASILKMGMLSQEARAFYGINAEGISDDFYEGGADSVFTQMVTKKDCESQMPFSRFSYTRDNCARLLFSIKNLDGSTYQYLDGNCGTRRIDDPFGGYLDRLNILEFIDALQSSPEFKGVHEVMFKERIFPGAILVSNESQKIDLLNGLRIRGVVQVDAAGNERISNTPVDQYIRVGERATDELFDI